MVGDLLKFPVSEVSIEEALAVGVDGGDDEIQISVVVEIAERGLRVCLCEGNTAPFAAIYELKAWSTGVLQQHGFVRKFDKPRVRQVGVHEVEVTVVVEVAPLRTDGVPVGVHDVVSREA